MVYKWVYCIHVHIQQVSFMLSALPTTFSFTSSLSQYHILPAIYSITIGLGNIIGECIICTLILSISRCLYQCVFYPLASLRSSPHLLYSDLSFPSHLSYHLPLSPQWQYHLPDHQYSLADSQVGHSLTVWPYASSPLLCLLIGSLLGMADGCLCPMRVIVCTLVAPEKKLQTYAVAKLYQVSVCWT